MKTLLIPYVLICLIGGIFYYSYNYTVLDFNEIVRYIIGIASGGDLYGCVDIFPVGPMWFCYSLFMVKLMALICKNRRYYCLSIMFMALVVMYVNRDFLPFRLDSSLVGFLFFYLGYYLKDIWVKIFSLGVKKNLLLFIISTLLTILLYTISLNFDHGFSININYYGKLPFLFIVSGAVGTVMILSLSTILSCLKLNWIYVFSVGMIIPLGFQKTIMLCLYHLNPSFKIEYVCLITIIFSYFLIQIISKVFPILLGGRRI